MSVAFTGRPLPAASSEVDIDRRPKQAKAWRMWLLDKMLRRLIKRGELTLIDHRGKAHHYGAPDPAIRSVTARLTNSRAAFKIASDPRVGAGEAYMDGSIVVEDGDIRDLILLVRYNAPFERPGQLKPKGPIRKTATAIAGRLD